MKGFKKIIREEFLVVLKENDEALYDSLNSYWNGFEKIKKEIVNDFLYDNNEDFTKEINWRVIPYSPVKRIWEDFMRTGEIRNVKGLESIERIAIRNTLLIDVITNFSGHVDAKESDDYLEESIKEFVEEQIRCYYQKPDDLDQLEMDFETGGHRKKVSQQPCTVMPFVKEFIEDNHNPDNVDSKNLENLLYDEILNNKFFDNYIAGGYITDYGLKPLRELVVQLYRENDPKKKLMLIDRVLNVTHQTSDLAAWFIQGGTNSLDDLSGYYDEDGDSTISGKYNMSDYYANNQ
jgi:hypothetical protein